MFLYLSYISTCGLHLFISYHPSPPLSPHPRGWWLGLGDSRSKVGRVEEGLAVQRPRSWPRLQGGQSGRQSQRGLVGSQASTAIIWGQQRQGTSVLQDEEMEREDNTLKVTWRPLRARVGVQIPVCALGGPRAKALRPG